MRRGPHCCGSRWVNSSKITRKRSVTARGRWFARACSTDAGFWRVICGGLRFIEAKTSETVFVCTSHARHSTAAVDKHSSWVVHGDDAHLHPACSFCKSKTSETHKVVSSFPFLILLQVISSEFCTHRSLRHMFPALRRRSGMCRAMPPKSHVSLSKGVHAHNN